MAQRRMFSKSIVDTDDFLDMPVSARCLYYDLGMRADDDGFVNPKRIMRITGASDDDLKILLAKKYVLNFENKVLVIRDWKVNNFIRPDRYTPTIYQEYLKKLQITDSNQYRLHSGIPNDIPLVGEGKVRLGKDSIGNIDNKLVKEIAEILQTEPSKGIEDYLVTYRHLDPKEYAYRVAEWCRDKPKRVPALTWMNWLRRDSKKLCQSNSSMQL